MLDSAFVMSNNKFIDKVLYKLSLVNPRLRCPLTRLQIQIEMQYPEVLFMIQYFIMLQPEYKYCWTQNCKLELAHSYNLIIIPEFLHLKEYFISRNLLNSDEADWLEDAIHETLIDDD